jgi:membrane associated rhomboid family serine protease
MKNYLKFEPFLFLVSIWVVFLLDIVIPIDFVALGIQPRTMTGLVGIITSPFIHGSFYHIISNSIPLLILGAIVRLHGTVIFWNLTLFVILLGGAITWLASTAGTVVGASGLIFGYWSFLIVYGFIHRSFVSLATSLFVIVFYGTMLFSFFRFYPHVSWIGHFAGALSGFIAAKYIFRAEQ